MDSLKKSENNNAFDSRIESKNTFNGIWQACEGLNTLPIFDLQQLILPDSRAVIMAPHPDDEVLGFGGLMQFLVKFKREILIIAVTEGEASHPGSLLWSPKRLAYVRAEERAKALACLGIINVPIIRLKLPDGRVLAHFDQLCFSLKEILKPTDKVFTTWSMDGHPDHEATGKAAKVATMHCGAQLLEAPIWMWHWASPNDSRVPWGRARRLNLPESIFNSKCLAMNHYVSQLEADSSKNRPPIISSDALKSFLHPYELFFYDE